MIHFYLVVVLEVDIKQFKRQKREISTLIYFYSINIMLYLFGTGSFKNDRKALKVGFTDDIDTRKNQYYLHNPLGEMLGSREGNELDELRLHLRLIDFKVEFLDEWFYNEPEVYKIFKEDYKDMNKWLWENRERTLLSPNIPLPGTLKRKLLDQIRKELGHVVIDGEKFLSNNNDL